MITANNTASKLSFEMARDLQDERKPNGMWVLPAERITSLKEEIAILLEQELVERGILALDQSALPLIDERQHLALAKYRSILQSKFDISYRAIEVSVLEIVRNVVQECMQHVNRDELREKGVNKMIHGTSFQHLVTDIEGHISLSEHIHNQLSLRYY